MPDPLPDALKLFRLKVSAPTELVTNDFDIVDVWTKERAFWMAGLADAEILQSFRNEIDRVVSGESGQVEAIGRLRMFLEQNGYEPAPGTEGTIKDLSTWRRMSVAIDMNVRMMRGYGNWLRAQKTLRAFPAWEFIRVAPRKVHRDWPSRWDKAMLATSDISGAGDNVALINHPVWRHLSAFGSPYPPYDWGSGMGVKLVGMRRAKELGLLDDPATDRLWKEMAVDSPNATLQAKTKVTEKTLRDALSRRLKGLARWDGDILVHTDPNGTRPATQDQLIDMWGNLPEEIEPRQERSFIEWVRDSGTFQEKPKYKPGSNQWDDMVRLSNRIEPSETAVLHRGAVFPETLKKGRPGITLDDFLKLIQEKGYETGFNKPTESWSLNQVTAETYAKTANIGKKWAVLFEIQSPRKARDIRKLVRHFSDQIGKVKNPSISQDAEFLYVRGTMLEVVTIKRNPETRIVNITLKERS